MVIVYGAYIVVRAGRLQGHPPSGRLPCRGIIRTCMSRGMRAVMGAVQGCGVVRAMWSYAGMCACMGDVFGGMDVEYVASVGRG